MILLMMLYMINTLSLTAAILPYTQPFFLLGVRMSIAGILLLGYLIMRGKLRLLKEHYGLYVHVMIFAIFVPYALRYYGLQYAAAPRAYMLYNLGPVITYFLAPYWADEKLTWQRTCALTISCIGMLLFLGNPLTVYCTTPLVWADLALVLSITSFCYGWSVMRKLVVNLNYAPALANGIAMFGGGILGLIASLCVETSPYMYNPSYFCMLLIALILISNVIGHNLYALLLRSYSLTLIQLGYWLSPVLISLGQAFLLQQALSFYTCISAVLLFTGFAWMYKQEYVSRPILLIATESI